MNDPIFLGLTLILISFAITLIAYCLCWIFTAATEVELIEHFEKEENRGSEEV